MQFQQIKALIVALTDDDYMGIKLQNQYVLELKLCGTLQLGLKVFINGPNNAKSSMQIPVFLLQRSHTKATASTIRDHRPLFTLLLCDLGI